jgi:hypothetical protein
MANQARYYSSMCTKKSEWVKEMQVAFMLDGPERTQELHKMGTQTSWQYLISKGKPGPSEAAPTSSSCRMDDVWTENIFSLYSCPIANHSV